MKELEWTFDEEEGIDIHPDFIGHEDFYNFLIEHGILDWDNIHYKWLEMVNKNKK